MAVLTTPDMFINNPIKRAITTTNVIEITALTTIRCNEGALCWESGVWVDQALL